MFPPITYQVDAWLLTFYAEKRGNGLFLKYPIFGSQLAVVSEKTSRGSHIPGLREDAPVPATRPENFTRGKFIELLGKMGDATVVSILAEELSHDDSNVRIWAVIALGTLRAPEGMNTAKMYPETHPAEFTEVQRDENFTSL